MREKGVPDDPNPLTMTDAPWEILAIAVPISQRLSFMYL